MTNEGQLVVIKCREFLNSAAAVVLLYELMRKSVVFEGAQLVTYHGSTPIHGRKS